MNLLCFFLFLLGKIVPIITTITKIITINGAFYQKANVYSTVMLSRKNAAVEW